jgi:ketosteroid isomerase-like protein
MHLDQLRINQLSADGWAFYERYLHALDAYDLETYLSFLADDVTIRFGDDEPLVGRDAARAGLGGFWAQVRSMGRTLVHEPLNIYGDDEHLVMEALNHYDTDDGRRTTVRATAWTDRGPDGRVTSIRLFQDLTPLFADPQRAGSQ